MQNKRTQRSSILSQEPLCLGRGRIACIAWHPNDEKIAVGGGNGVWLYTDTFQLLKHIENDGHVDVIKWSPGGDRLIALSGDGIACIWDTARDQPLHTLDDYYDIRAVAWGASGELATAHVDKMVRIWDVAMNRLLTSLPGYDTRFQVIDWSSDGQRLAIADERSKEVEVWDVENQELVNRVRLHHYGVKQLAWGPDGERLAVINRPANDHRVYILKVITGHVLAKTEGKGISGIDKMAWSPDGSRLATTSETGEVHVWDATTGQVVATLRERETSTVEPTSISWSHNGRQLASSSSRLNIVQVWETTGYRCLSTLKEHTGSVSFVSWNSVGSMLASMHGDGYMCTWDLASGQCLNKIKCARWFDLSKQPWNPRMHNQLAVATSDYKLQVRDVRLGKSATIYSGNESEVATIAWNSTGDKLAVSSHLSKRTEIWDLNTVELLTTIDAEAMRVAWSPDSSKLLIGHEIWDVGERRVVKRLENLHQYVVAWHPAESKIAQATMDRQNPVEIWNVETNELLGILGDIGDHVSRMVWSPDGTKLVGSNWGYVVMVWDVTTMGGLTRLEGHESSVMAMGWSPDSTRIATGGYDNTVRIWNPVTGQMLVTLRGHTSTVWSVAWSPDGNRIASAGRDGTVRVWSATE